MRWGIQREKIWGQDNNIDLGPLWEIKMEMNNRLLYKWIWTSVKWSGLEVNVTSVNGSNGNG